MAEKDENELWFQCFMFNYWAYAPCTGWYVEQSRHRHRRCDFCFWIFSSQLFGINWGCTGCCNMYWKKFYRYINAVNSASYPSPSVMWEKMAEKIFLWQMSLFPSLREDESISNTFCCRELFVRSAHIILRF